MISNSILKSVNVIVILLSLILTCTTGPIVVDPSLHTPNHAVVLTTNNFDSLILNNNSLALVEFYQPRCVVCGSMMWILDSLAVLYSDSILVGAVDVDSNSSLHEQFNINGIPSFVLFDKGNILTQRSYFQADSTAFDTLTSLLQQGISGTLVQDPSGTGTIDSTLYSYPTLDSLTFDSTVLQPGRVAMVFFLYENGYPCIYMDSIVATIVPKFYGKAVIAKIHAWDQYTISERYGITSVPRFLFFKNGSEVTEEYWMGTFEGDSLTAVLNRLLEE